MSSRHGKRSRHYESDDSIVEILPVSNVTEIVRDATSARYGTRKDEMAARVKALHAAADEYKKQILSSEYKAAALDNELKRLRSENASLQKTISASQESEKKYRKALGRLLEYSGSPPFILLLDVIGGLNSQIERVATYLSDNVVHMDAEAFAEEMNCVNEEARGLVGEHLVSALKKHSKRMNAARVARPNPLLVQIVFQIFTAAFCARCIEHGSLCLDNGGVASEERGYHRSWIADTFSSFSEFKAKYLKNISVLFKAASWALPGEQKRKKFEDLLAPLFNARQDTRSVLNDTNNSTHIEISLIGYQRSFQGVYMEDAFNTHVPGSLREGSTDQVIGTVGLGIKQAVRGTGGRDLIKGVLPARVVLEKTLKAAVTSIGRT